MNTLLREFFSQSFSPSQSTTRKRIGRFEAKSPRKKPTIKVHNYRVALLASLVDRGTLDCGDINDLSRSLLNIHADKAECTDWLHRVFLPRAEQSDDKALWTTLTLLAVYLDETAIARRAAKHSGNTHLQHYLAWGLGDLHPATDDPLGGRNASSNPSDSQQSGVTIGILDYKSPDRQQTNTDIDAIIHSVAFMRHLARFYQPHWSLGDPRLATALQFLQHSWPEDAQQPSPQPVNLRIFDRDSAWAGANPTETTYLPLYGLFAKRPFGTLPVFPLPPHIQPLFLSIHLDLPKHLLPPPATIAWLKTCEPIGCRDKTTSDYLASAGVQTFFAGCLTTTLQLAAGSISPPQTPRAEHYRVNIKAAAADIEYTALSHQSWRGDRLPRQPFAANVLEAIDLLQAYQQAQSVRTSQLHCYLPCRALGTAVTYIPEKPANPQLTGLHDLSQAELHRMQTTLRDLTAHILAKIFSGATPAEVRATWRELTAPLVAATEAERSTTTPLFVRHPSPPKIHSPKDQAPKDQATEDKASTVVQVVMAFDTNLVRYVPNVVRSIQAHSSVAVAYHFLIDGVSAADQATLHQACPDIDCTWYDMAEHLNKSKLHYKTNKSITRSTMSRLFLPERLAQIDKVIYLDIDIIVLGDIAELAAVELGDAPLAACYGTDFPQQPLDFLPIHHHKKKLRANLTERFQFWRAASLCGDITAPYFNAGVLVLSLDTLRRDHFTAQALRATTHLLHDQQLLNFYAGGDYVHLSPKWNLTPQFINCVDLESIGIIHWKGEIKPWHGHGHVHTRLWERFS